MTATPTTLLALGDCNTLGIGDCLRNTYVERFARERGLSAVNCGCTMATTREGLHYFARFFTAECAVVTIQFGLVDSWRTFKFAPYVLYYPDNPLRKLARKLTKKYKRWARQWGWNQRWGEVEVVPPSAYRANLEQMLQRSAGATVLLLDTPPNQDASRNPAIQRYNGILAELAGQYRHARHVAFYDELTGVNAAGYFHDSTHLNAAGHQLVAHKLSGCYAAGRPLGLGGP